jgi:hypothetical protein
MYILTNESTTNSVKIRFEETKNKSDIYQQAIRPSISRSRVLATPCGVSNYVGRDSSVGIATRNGLDGPGIEFR